MENCLHFQEWLIICCTYVSFLLLFICLSIDIHLGFFHLRVVANDVSMNMGTNIWDLFSTVLWIDSLLDNSNLDKSETVHLFPSKLFFILNTQWCSFGVFCLVLPWIPITRFWFAVRNHPVSSWMCFLLRCSVSKPFQGRVSGCCCEVAPFIPLQSRMHTEVFTAWEVWERRRSGTHLQICLAIGPSFWWTHTNIWRLKGSLRSYFLPLLHLLVLSLLYLFLLIDCWAWNLQPPVGIYPWTTSQTPIYTSAFPYGFSSTACCANLKSGTFSLFPFPTLFGSQLGNSSWKTKWNMSDY